MTDRPAFSPTTSAAPPGAGLVLVRCPSWEALRDDLTAALAHGPVDPFAGQVVVCESAAARRDLSQTASSRLGSSGRAGGVCAGVRFTGVRGLRRDLVERLLGEPAATDPWRSRGLALAVLDEIDRAREQEWLWPVVHHLGDDSTRPGRRMATAERIARLYLRYVLSAPELVRAWNAGTDGGPEGELSPGQLWQPRLWRQVRERLAAEGAHDPLTRHEALMDAIAGAGASELLPRTDGRLLLADPTPSAPLDRELLVALSHRLPVTLWLLDAVPGRTRTLSRQRWAACATDERTLAPAVPPPARREFHASHGPDRQVEVLREVLCGVLQDDPTLEPRDVVVACTDLETFAPLVRAAFCLDEEAVGARLHPGHQLRVQLADSSLAQPNQVLETLSQVLRLATDRATAQDLVDLCASRPVATRFGLDEDDQERIVRLVGQADIRWGLDGRHRAAFGVGQVRQSTWLAGVERILVGVAMGTQPLRWVGTALPVDQVDSSDVMAAGTLAEVVSRVRKLVADWRAAATVQGWVSRLHEALDLLCATSRDDAWMLTAAHAELADLADLTLDRTAELSLGDVRVLFDRMVRPRGGRAAFGNGSLLVCGLDDLGNVPHRVVAVLGLDDQRFPARPPLDGDDLTSWQPLDAEVDPRARSRQLLDDAVASARDLLVVVHQGATTRTNQHVPRPVAVVDLQEAGDGRGIRRMRHTLQPQSSLNFATGGGQAPASFDRQALLGARARRAVLERPPVAAQPLWRTPLPSARPGDAERTVDLDALLAFYRHPARELLRHTLGVTMTEWSEPLPDELPIEPNGLGEWALGERMVRLALEGMDPEQVVAAERLRGELPPGTLGSRTLNRIGNQVDKVIRAAQRETAQVPHDLDCEVELGDVLLTGRVRVHGNAIVSHSFSKASGAHLLQAWLGLLLLAASHPAPAVGWRAVHVARDGIVTLQAPPAGRALQLLGELVALRERGLAQLVPLPARTAAEFRGLVPLRPYGDHDPDAAARTAFGREHDEDWGRFLSHDIDALRAVPPESGDPGTPGPSRFENLSDWLFTPIREQMSVGNPA